MLGSLRFKFIATALRRRSDARLGRGEPRFRVAEFLLDKSAALMVAAAARDTEDDLGEGDGVLLNRESAGGIEVLIARVFMGEAEVEREGGRELMSGAILLLSLC